VPNLVSAAGLSSGGPISGNSLTGNNNRR
jgi:hypothetical protein